MTDEKNLNNGYETHEVSAEDLKKVTGGNKPGYQTTNHSTYRSGDTPKYNIGDKVQVKFIPVHFSNGESWIDFFVTGVSTYKNGGMICKEYTYSLKDAYDGSSVLTDVYESCLRKAK